MILSRREALGALASCAWSARAAAASDSAAHTAVARGVAAAQAPYSLPPLPYPAAALEPHSDARTMQIHHGKHHQGYVDNLNAALKAAPQVASNRSTSCWPT